MRTRSLKTIIYTVLALSFTFTPLIVAAAAVYPPPGHGNAPKFTNPLGSRTIPQILQDLVRFLLGLIALLALAGIIYGGLKVITSFGDSGKVESGKHIIFWSIVGLVIAVGAVVIVEVVANILGI